MRWSERQQALLRGMGLRLWAPAAAATLPGEPTAGAAEPAEPALAVPASTRPSPAMAGRTPANAAAALPASPASPAAVQPGPLTKTPVAPIAGRSPSAPNAPKAPAARPVVAASAADAAAVAGLDWPTLQAAVSACRACTLCDTRRQTVFGVGHPQAQWMFVGEAPGEQEDRQGEPFVGAAGQLLDRMLAALGLARGPAAAAAGTATAAAPNPGTTPGSTPGNTPGDPARQVYIANTLKCRPPGNRNPTPEELAQCAPFLERQVALVQPRVIVAMGRFAVQALLNSQEPIGRLRGRVHTWQGRPLVVTYHPAYLLRQPADKAKAWADLCLAAQCLEAH